MSIKLSICIPTYNRADCLPTALDSVLDQLDDRVEVLICDNGSKDSTEELVQTYLKKYPAITYIRLPQNIGPDRCFLQSIESAKGDYCWFLGDDDLIEKKSLMQVLSILEKNPSLSGISVNRRIFDKTLQFETSTKPIQKHLRQDHLYLDVDSCIEDLFIYFGYMSGQICKRTLWKEAVQKTENITQFFNAYIIPFVIIKMLLIQPKWLFLHNVYVRYRSDNDSFGKELGAFPRFLLDVNGYEQMAKALFGKSSKLYRSALNQISSTHLKNRIFNILEYKKVKNFRLRALIAMLPKYFKIHSFWIKNVPILLLPRPFLLFLRKIYWIQSRIREKISSTQAGLFTPKANP